MAAAPITILDIRGYGNLSEMAWNYHLGPQFLTLFIQLAFSVD